MTTTNVSTAKMYCACSGKWCEFANLQGFCTLTACCKRVIYDGGYGSYSYLEDLKNEFEAKTKEK